MNEFDRRRPTNRYAKPLISSGFVVSECLIWLGTPIKQSLWINQESSHLEWAFLRFCPIRNKCSRSLDDWLFHTGFGFEPCSIEGSMFELT
jgi:hypothetical protein